MDKDNKDFKFNVKMQDPLSDFSISDEAVSSEDNSNADDLDEVISLGKAASIMQDEQAIAESLEGFEVEKL